MLCLLGSGAVKYMIDPRHGPHNPTIAKLANIRSTMLRVIFFCRRS